MLTLHVRTRQLSAAAKIPRTETETEITHSSVLRVRFKKNKTLSSYLLIPRDYCVTFLRVDPFSILGILCHLKLACSCTKSLKIIEGKALHLCPHTDLIYREASLCYCLVQQKKVSKCLHVATNKSFSGHLFCMLDALISFLFICFSWKLLTLFNLFLCIPIMLD